MFSVLSITSYLSQQKCNATPITNPIGGDFPTLRLFFLQLRKHTCTPYTHHTCTLYTCKHTHLTYLLIHNHYPHPQHSNTAILHHSTTPTFQTRTTPTTTPTTTHFFAKNKPFYPPPNSPVSYSLSAYPP